METLFKYHDECKSKVGDLRGSCDLLLTREGDKITYTGEFKFLYPRKYISKASNFLYQHSFEIDLKICTYTTSYLMSNDSPVQGKTRKIKKNNFKGLAETISRGLMYGESRMNYWGSKYKYETRKLTNIIEKILRPRFKSPYYKNKKLEYEAYYPKLYILLVDFFLDYHNIKGHDNVYYHIENHKPQKKYLKVNDGKFLPSVLESLKIKNKYFVGVLSSSKNNINILSLNYMCKIFGANYINYIKQIPWPELCSIHIPTNKKAYELKNNIEKQNLVELCNDWKRKDDERISSFTFLYNISSLLTIRHKLEQKGLDLKFTARTRDEFEKMEMEWNLHYQYFQRGYKLRYVYPEDFLSHVEQPIVIDGQKFKVRLLQTEDEFKLEGIRMKNCMSNQFNNGIILNFFYMEHNRKRINVSFQRGQTNQAYGKSNSTLPEIFAAPIKVLSEKLQAYKDIKWYREKYDIIK